MDDHACPPKASRPATTISRLKRLSPSDHDISAHTQRELPSNGAGVNYVRHHSLMTRDLESSWDIVEKSLRKPLFYKSREARFYRYYAMLAACRRMAYPALLDVVETPLSSKIYSEYIEGTQPVRASVLRDAAEGIAELEAVSARYIASRPPSLKAPLDFWLMDFFRWPYMRHTRLNFQRFLGNLDPLPISDTTRDSLVRRLRALRPWLTSQAGRARRTRRCISHLDYAAKNMLVDGERLYLLDWSEVKVGRIGFDGGDYLGKLFAHASLERFKALRASFEKDYFAALDKTSIDASSRRDRSSAPRHDSPIAQARQNGRYLFTTLALWRCLQRQSIEGHLEANTTDELVAKLDYLLAEPERRLHIV